ncbi:ABC transporter substrate-binding protein [Microbacterium betulae]|uniref:ABC transporter substrate-binding protein n=1 Tax=Microbacterium betulae TaxID=2981139 RepID=A0AA97I712_9MICO|nr:ABC transporter substrate-binding protein [Microbacterium sp. AB]WOF23192.1 ABC transporter substrate-binding protein [Microbacterium sp. AB]
MRIPRRLPAALALAASAALILSSCAAQEQSAPAATSDGSPVDGGELVVAIGNDPVSLNPSGTGSGNDTWNVNRQIVDSLLYQNPETQALEPWLAESYEVSDDATTFTFHLRDDVTFSDGTPLTAEVVRGTFDDIVAAGAASQNGASLLVGYEETVVVDEHTAEVRFAKPNAAFPNSVASVTLGIVGAATFDTAYEERADGSAVVGSGPFVVDHYTKDVETVLTARDDYAWAPEAFGNDGAPHLDEVTFQVVPEPSVRTGGLVSGQFDAVTGVQPSDQSQVQDAGLTLVDRVNPGLSFGLSVNVARPAVSDVAVREAIAAAIDPQVVVDTALNELYSVADSSLSSTTPAYASQAERFAYDPEHAAALLDEAGWEEGSDGVREKDGEPLEILLLWSTNNSTNQTVVELVQQQLAQVGIGVELVSGTVPEVVERQASGDFDLSWGNLSRADGDVLRTTFSSATTRLGIDDPELDALLQEQLAVTGDERDAVLADVQERIASQYYQIPVHELTSVIGTQLAVHGLQFGADSRLDSLAGTWKDAE